MPEANANFLTEERRRAVDRKCPFCKIGKLCLIGRMPPGEIIPVDIAVTVDTS